MIADISPALVPAFLLVLALLVFLHQKIFGLRERTAEEVLPFLRQVDMEEVRHLFSAEAELYLRLNVTPAQFRRQQRNRMILALEYIRRMSHNVLVFQQWANYEVSRGQAAGDPKRAHLGVDLIAASANCRMCSFVLRTRLYTWLLRMAFLPFAAPPSFESLIKFGSADMLDFYGKVRAAATELSRSYGDAHHQKIAEFL